jgi:hypothetical protein
VNAIASVVFTTPSTVAVTVKEPAVSEVSFTVEPPADPVCDVEALSVPPVDAHATDAPETPAPFLMYLSETVTASVLSAVAEVLSTDRVTPPPGLPA